MRDVDPDPFASEPLRDGDRRATAAEWVEHHVALVAAREDDALQQRLRLLRWVAEALVGLGAYRIAKRCLSRGLAPRNTAASRRGSNFISRHDSWFVSLHRRGLHLSS